MFALAFCVAILFLHMVKPTVMHRRQCSDPPYTQQSAMQDTSRHEDAHRYTEERERENETH